MSDAKSPPELSMDEILATIRRIIAEDEQPGGPSSGGTASGGTGTGTGVAAGGLDRRRAANAAAGNTADDIVELTAAINEDGSVRHLAPIGGKSRIAQLREPAPVAAQVEPEPEPAPSPADAPNRAAVPEQAGTPGQAGDGRLASDVASTAAAAAFAGLAPARPARELPLGAADRTLEEIVRDLLRPVLQTWLDEHLPEVVERLVKAEITRAGKIGPS